jgi:aldose 1-epimerase
VELSAGTTRLTVDEELGARVSSLLVAGTEGDLQLAGRYRPSAHGWGAFPMAPWAGRVRDGRLAWRGQVHQLPTPKPPHAIHGLVATVPWTVAEASESSAVLTRDVGPDWPWPAHAVLRYDLAPAQLETTLEVHAEDAEMPTWSGIHPWFPRRLGAAEVGIELAARAMLARDDAGITTATEVPVPAGAPMDPAVDDVFADVTWPVVLTWPGVLRLEVTADTPWAVVFTEREEAVCVEPQTAPPDAAALGMAPTAAPGRPLVLHTSWRWDSPA